jgi:hypothetical protein
MIFVPRAVRVFFATQPTSMRKSFDGLSNDIRHALGHDPLSGHIFVLTYVSQCTFQGVGCRSRNAESFTALRDRVLST